MLRESAGSGGKQAPAELLVLPFPGDGKGTRRRMLRRGTHNPIVVSPTMFQGYIEYNCSGLARSQTMPHRPNHTHATHRAATEPAAAGDRVTVPEVYARRLTAAHASSPLTLSAILDSSYCSRLRPSRLFSQYNTTSRRLVHERSEVNEVKLYGMVQIN
uniref:Uncharacterized protein n=1 Tax=Leersia perrieri TaxID=77586 RepID=A0A0D9WNC2_9ORYZ